MSKKLETVVYTQAGKKSGTIALPESVFGAAWKPNLVHEVVVALQANARTNAAHTKDRSEVRGGGKKPWRQKGTGRARHGSRRSPIWTGGGVAHGPRNERDYHKKINKNMRATVLASVLSKKFTEDKVLFVEELAFEAPKTQEAKDILVALGATPGHTDLATKKKNTALIVLPDRDLNVEKSFRNFGNVVVGQVKDINPVALLTYKYVVVAKPDVVLSALSHRVATKTARKATTVK